MFINCDEKVIKFYRTLWKDSFTEAPKRSQEKSAAEDIKKDSLGWGHFARLYRDDEDELIKDPGNCERPTVRTFQTLFKNTLVDDDVHWFVFNTFCTSVAVTKKRKDEQGKVISMSGGRREAMVRWINAIAIDVDIKFDHIDELLERFKKAKLPSPTVVHSTKRGYHVYWILEERVPGTPQAKKLYKHIMKNIQMALNKDIEVMDKRAKDLVRYLQVPRNIIVENYESRPSFSEFQIWMNTYGEVTFNKKNNVRNSSSNLRNITKSSKKNYEHVEEKHADFLMQEMLEKGVNGGDRNRAVYVLASYFKVRGYSSGRTENILVDWNEKHGHTTSKNPHTEEETIRTVESVYSNDRVFPYSWLEELTGSRISRSIKHKRNRSNRIQSHYTERIKDMMYYLIENEIGLIYGSQRELCVMFGMEKSTLSEIIKILKTGKFGRLLEVVVEGKGRNSRTIIRLNPVVFKKYKERKLETFMNKIFEYDENIQIFEYEIYMNKFKNQKKE